MNKYKSFHDISGRTGANKYEAERPVVCIQGLGFVGAAMAVAVAMARRPDGNPWFNVVGVDLPTTDGMNRISAVNNGAFPFKCADDRLEKELRKAVDAGNLVATDDPKSFSLATVIIVDIHLDVSHDGGKPLVNFDGFKNAIRTIGQYARPGCLIIIETTVPPGTCEKIVAPELRAAMRERGLDDDSLLLAHSYERVMPGKNYLDSIVDFWRVFAGFTREAADACENFLSKIINVDKYPLSRLSSVTSSEMGKILENSYRAVNIAFMEEWGRFAEVAGVDIFEVVEAIRKRPTHCNIRTPGFGVGGYCLTKDPLFSLIAARDLFKSPDLEFPFSTAAVRINNSMPLVSLNKLKSALRGTLKGKKILLLGITYLQDVGDTRYSPSQTFVETARQEGADITCHDPLIEYWPELNEAVLTEIPPVNGFDAIVFAVPHDQYRNIAFRDWISNNKVVILDTFNILTLQQRKDLKAIGCKVIYIGRGEDT
jgi:nucleotide sugar dehydrogenase